jgi:hypothetical protein
LAGLSLVALSALLTASACGSLTTAPSAPSQASGEGDAGFGGVLAEDDGPGDEPSTLLLPLASSGSEAGTGATRPPSTTTVTAGDAASPAVDAAPDGACALPLGAGGLAMEELMIASVAGSGDYGQWIEIRSMVACTQNLFGLHGECAKGSKVNTFDVTTDLWLDPSASFVVADSSDPVVNHYLPGEVLVWSGEPGDVLRKEGATVTLSVGTTLVDSITYPDFKGPVGTSLSFPSDCAPSQRSDWGSWQLSTASWFPGFFGTPNAPNTDVSCPIDP